MFDPAKAQVICDNISSVVGFGVIFAYENGVIQAASDRSRIGAVHATAARIMAGEITQRGVTADEAARSTGMREGYNLALNVDGVRVASLGVAGPVEDAEKMAKLAAGWAQSMIAVDLANEAREQEMRALVQQLHSEIGGAIGAMLQETTQCLAALRGGRAAAERTRASSDAASQSIDQAHDAAAQTLQAMTELSERTREMDHRVSGAAATVSDAEQRSGQAVTAVEALGTATDAITKALQLIDELAMRTRLLSLNAAVEAARAGEAGRGFAIVAQEVRGLSEETTGSTKKIEDDVRAVRDRSSDVSEALRQIEASVAKLGEANRQLVDGFEAQSTMIDGASAAVGGAADQTRSSLDAMRTADQAAGEALSAVTEAEKAVERTARMADDARLRVEALVRALSSGQSGQGPRRAA